MGLAGLTSRSAVYTITNRRVVMRIGIALPMTINIPFKVVESASAKVFGNGTGDIPIHLTAPNRLAFLILWPHARPWCVSQPEPTLRSVPEAATVARLLATALAGATTGERIPLETAPPAHIHDPLPAAVA
jgi:hypothetical protein